MQKTAPHSLNVICINKSQKGRGTEFKKIIEDTCDLIFCDNSEHKIGDTAICFSPPFFH